MVDRFSCENLVLLVDQHDVCLLLPFPFHPTPALYPICERSWTHRAARRVAGDPWRALQCGGADGHGSALRLDRRQAHAVHLPSSANPHGGMGPDVHLMVGMDRLRRLVRHQLGRGVSALPGHYAQLLWRGGDGGPLWISTHAIDRLRDGSRTPARRLSLRSVRKLSRLLPDQYRGGRALGYLPLDRDRTAAETGTAIPVFHGYARLHEGAKGRREYRRERSHMIDHSGREKQFGPVLLEWLACDML